MSVQRLPIPNQDDGTWGTVLNGYLGVSHASDGTLAANTVGATQLLDASVTAQKLDSPTQTAIGSIAAKAPIASPTFSGTVTVPTPVNSTDATTKIYVDTQVSSGTADATASTKGKIQLAGDLTGTAAAPTVVGLAAKAPLASPTFTGTVTVPTPVNSSDAATKSYVDTKSIAYALLPVGTLVVADYNTSGSAYPTRPTSRTDIVVRWRGPVAPMVGGSGAVDNVDEWLNTAP